MRILVGSHCSEYAAGPGQSWRELHELAADSHGGAKNGYAEGIALDNNGFVSEGSGENIFVIRDGKIHTPPLGASVLPGITRDSIIKIAGQLGIPIVETIIPRELLYIADEVFFCGTAVEVTPIRSVDRIEIGNWPARSHYRSRSRSDSSKSYREQPRTNSAGSLLCPE